MQQLVLSLLLSCLSLTMAILSCSDYQESNSTGFSQSKTLRSDWSTGRQEWSTLLPSWLPFIGCRFGTESTSKSPHLHSAVSTERHHLILWNWSPSKRQHGVGFALERTPWNSSCLPQWKSDGENDLFPAVHPGFGTPSLLNSALFLPWLVFDPDSKPSTSDLPSPPNKHCSQLIVSLRAPLTMQWKRRHTNTYYYYYYYY